MINMIEYVNEQKLLFVSTYLSTISDVYMTCTVFKCTSFSCTLLTGQNVRSIRC